MANVFSVACCDRVRAQTTELDAKSNLPPRTVADEDDPLTKGILDELLPIQPEERSDENQQARSQEEDLAETLVTIQRDLSRAAQMMRRNDPATQVVQLQGSIVDRMEELIKKLRSEMKQQKSESSMSEQKELQQQGSAEQQQLSNSRIVPDSIPNEAPSQANLEGEDSALDPSDSQSGKSELALADRLRMVEGVWGHLPDRIRRESISSGSLRFMPKYEKMLQQYYRQLSSESPQPLQPKQ